MSAFLLEGIANIQNKMKNFGRQKKNMKAPLRQTGIWALVKRVENTIFVVQYGNCQIEKINYYRSGYVRHCPVLQREQDSWDSGTVAKACRIPEITIRLSIITGLIYLPAFFQG